MTETAAARDTRDRARWSLQSALEQCDKFCRDNNQRLEQFTDAYLVDCRGKAVSIVREINRAMSGGSTDAEPDPDPEDPAEQLRDSCCCEAAADHEPSTTTRPAGPGTGGASSEEGTGAAAALAAAGQQQDPDPRPRPAPALMEVVQLLEEERKAQDKQMENLRKRWV